MPVKSNSIILIGLPNDNTTEKQKIRNHPSDKILIHGKQRYDEVSTLEELIVFAPSGSPEHDIC